MEGGGGCCGVIYLESFTGEGPFHVVKLSCEDPPLCFVGGGEGGGYPERSGGQGGRIS